MEIAYFSRGSFQYHAVLKLSAVERDIALELIKERQESLANNPFAQI